MIHVSLRLALGLLVAILLPACGGSGDTFVIQSGIPPASGSVLYVTENNVLINVSATAPSTIISAVGLTGLAAGEDIVGIDYRPATGELFGITAPPTSRMYRIFPMTGACVPVGAPGGFVLSGTSWGFDVNPVADRLRTMSDGDQNLRLNPDTGLAVTIDTALAFAAGDPNVGANPNVVACAYTNNFAGTAVTSLYAIDSSLDILVLLPSPNNGQLTTVGALGIDVSGLAHFDIRTVAMATNTAYAALEVGGVTSLYTINLTTGAATIVGTLGTGAFTRGLAVVP
jgi:hypothetical protein